MVSTENRVTLAFVLVALPAAYAVDAATGQFRAAFLTLNVVGVGLPSLYLRAERRRGAAA